MDRDLIIKLMATCVKYNLPRGTHAQQKEDVKIVFSKSFLKSSEFEQFCREIETTPGEFLLEINRPSGPGGPKVPLYMSKDMNPEHFLFTVHKLKRNQEALNDCLTDILETWMKDGSGKLKRHHKLNDKMVKGYLKLRDCEHPDEDRKISHEDIKTSVRNYQLWATAAKNNPQVWFQLWDLSGFLRSNKAVTEWCYDRNMMIAKVGDQFFDVKGDEPDEDPIEATNRKLSFLKNIQFEIAKGQPPVGEFLEYWETNKHLLGKQND